MDGVDPDRRFRRDRSARRRLCGLARADFGCGPHGHGRGVVRRRAHCRRRDRAPPILRSTLALLKESTGVLLEGVPVHVSYDNVGRALAALPGVTEVHDLHVWQMNAERVALSAHLTLADGPAWPRVLASAQRMLAH